MSAAWAQIAGAASVIAYLAFILWIGRKRPRSLVQLASMFVAAGLMAAFAAGYIERGLENILLLMLPEKSLAFEIADAFICVALAEELIKYGVLLAFTMRGGRVSNSLEGMVCSGVTALGFALFENVSYIALYGSSATLWRVFSAVPGHLADGLIMGYFYGKAKEREIRGENSAHGWLYAAAILVPAAEHAVYDALASAGTNMLFAFYVTIINIAALAFIWRLAKKYG
jgi:RsiW-degrading membrane proteinase PrsW (M82 family)